MHCLDETLWRIFENPHHIERLDEQQHLAREYNVEPDLIRALLAALGAPRRAETTPERPATPNRPGRGGARHAHG